MGVIPTGPTQAVCRLVIIISWVAFYCLDNSVVAQEIFPSARTSYQQALNTNNSEAKIRLLQRAVSLSPQFVNARLELAKNLIDLGQSRRAISHLDSALDYDRRNAYLWFQKGRAHANLSENGAALKCFERAISLRNAVPEFHLHLGRVNYQAKSYDEAMVSFERTLSIAIKNQNHSQQAEAWYWKGRVHQINNDTTDALVSFRRALQPKPDHTEAKSRLSKLEEQISLATSYRQAQESINRQKWQQAKAIFQSIFKTDSTFKDVSEKLTFVDKKIEQEIAGNQPKISRQEDQADTSSKSPETSLNAASRSSDTPILDNSPEQPNTQIVKKPVEINRDTSETAIPLEPMLDKDTNVPQAKPENETKPVAKTPWFWIGGVGVLLSIVAILSVLFFSKKRSPISSRTLKVGPAPHTTITLIPPGFLQSELGRYHIETEIGRGGMGQVFKAYDTKLDRLVALKVIRFENTMDKEEIKERINRFRREAKATASLNHPNIVSLYDYEEKGGLFYISMEYVDGDSIQDLLDKDKRLKIKQAVKIVTESCMALEYAHRKKLIHRDIKPSNIMLNQEGNVKLLDFGIAKMLTLTRTQSPTMTGMRLGSPNYMSPEQINAGILDGRSDIFALGVVFYEMLTGKKPFQIKPGDSLAQLFYAILNTVTKKPSSIRKAVSTQKLDSIVNKMLAKDPDKRFQNAKEIIHALKS